MEVRCFFFFLPLGIGEAWEERGKDLREVIWMAGLTKCGRERDESKDIPTFLA